MKKFYPVSEPSIGSLEQKYVEEATNSGWVSSLGAFIQTFEEKLTKLSGKKLCLSSSNGTTALHLALLASNVTDNDEVIVTDWTFVAPINAVLYCGATPVLAPVEKNTGMPNVSSIMERITAKTKAVIIVHPYGKVFPVPDLVNLMPDNIRIIEDCAEAHGAKYKNGGLVGSASYISTFSFYGNKIVTTGEGGAICTNCNQAYDLVKELRDHAMSPNNRYYHEKLGFNYRMTNMQAALGCAQLERMDEMLLQRDTILAWYVTAFTGHNRIRFLIDYEGVTSVNWLTTVFVSGLTRVSIEKISSLLLDEGIQTRPVFYSASSFPYLQETSKTTHSGYSKLLSDEGISLPTYLSLKQEDVEFIVKKFIKVLDVM
ncbi:MAG: DegT/DnrJ/EryC1/StrS family aminotransferase [Neptuniibacter sp.]